jgi:uncharacterized protein (TIGR02284 family)
MANDDKAITNLIAVLKDGEKGFNDIGEHLKAPAHKAFFMEESKVRGAYASELERSVNRVTDANVSESGTAAGAIHRTWGDIKAKLGGGDHSLLETAEQGEDAAKKAYKEALDDVAVSNTIRALIAQQYEHVKHSHDKVKAFRDATK